LQVEVVVSLLPASFHVAIARVCIELKKHMVTASYVDESMSNLKQAAKGAGVTILCEMGLDPGIGISSICWSLMYILMECI
jgi:alpha-aminoadipic semialdehyde synthase